MLILLVNTGRGWFQRIKTPKAYHKLLKFWQITKIVAHLKIELGRGPLTPLMRLHVTNSVAIRDSLLVPTVGMRKEFE